MAGGALRLEDHLFPLGGKPSPPRLATNRLLPLPEGQKQSLELSKDVPPQTAKRGWAVFVVGAVFTLTGIVGAGLSAILPGVLVRFGVSPTAAIAASTLIGPMQFLSRFTEAGFLSRFHPLYSARLACILHPIGSLILALGGPVTAPAFVAFYAAGNGILTISRGTLPLILFGPESYGKLGATFRHPRVWPGLSRLFCSD